MGALRIGVKSQEGPVYIGPASNLTVSAKIGSRDLKLVLDTGAARSIIRTRVSKGLAESELSRDAIIRRVPIKNNVCCEGVEKSKKFPPLEKVVYLTLTLVGYAPGSPEKEKEVKVEVMACELAESSEPLIVGLSDLAEWGISLEPTKVSDRPLVHLTALDLVVPSSGNQRPEPLKAGSVELRVNRVTLLAPYEATRVPVATPITAIAPKGTKWVRAEGEVEVRLAEQPVEEVIDDEEKGTGRAVVVNTTPEPQILMPGEVIGTVPPRP